MNSSRSKTCPQDVLRAALELKARGEEITSGSLAIQLGCTRGRITYLLVACRKLEGWDQSWCRDPSPSRKHPWYRDKRNRGK